MRKELPKEPINIGFNPEREGSMDMGVLMVFRDDIARTLWLMIKPQHLTDQHFPEFCMKTADVIRRREPRSARELFSILCGQPYFNCSFEEAEVFLERIHLAVTGKKPIRYRVVLPGSAEERKLHRIRRKRGYWHGILGKPPESLDPHYRDGFHRGAKLNRKIREAPKPEISYA